MPSLSFCVFAVLDFAQKPNTLFLVQELIVPILGGFSAITPVNDVIIVSRRSQNQGPISFQFSMKTVITFCAIYDFSRYKRFQGQRSRGSSLS